MPLTDAIKMAARARADLVLFDDDIRVSRVIVGGRDVYVASDYTKEGQKN